MKALIFNVCNKQKFLALVPTKVSREGYHLQSTLVLGGPCERGGSFFEAWTPYIQIRNQ